MSAPLVSVVMPVYNGTRYLGEALASLRAQTVPWELVLVDDASTDDTLAVARDLTRGDDRCRIVPLAVNGGPARARNIGIANARARYLAFLDADDRWLSHKLAVQVDAMRRGGLACSCHAYRRIDGEGRVLGRAVPVRRRVGHGDLLLHNPIGCLSVMIDRDRVDPIVMPRVPHEDFGLWLDITRRGHRFVGIPRVLAEYREHAGGITANKWKSMWFTWRCMARVERATPPLALATLAGQAVWGWWKRQGL